MKDQMRMLVAIVFLVAMLSLYPIYLKWLSPAKTPGEVPAPQKTEELASPAAKQLPKEVKHTRTKDVVKEELFGLDVPGINATFSTIGGSVKELVASAYVNLHKDTATLIDIDKGLRGSYTLTFPLEKIAPEGFIFRRDKSLETSDKSVAFSAVKDETVKISKIYSLDESGNALKLAVRFENVSQRPYRLEYEISTQLHFTAPEAEGQDAGALETGVRLSNKVESQNLGHVAKKGYLKEGAIDWLFVSKKYFTLITDPLTKDFVRSRSVKMNDNEMANFGLMPPVELAPGASETHEFLLFAGPKEYNALKSYKRDYEGLLSKGFFGLFRIWLLLALQFFYHWLHNWGWAIIVITCLIKLAFTPLTHISYDSMKKMQALQPKIKHIQEKYKKEPDKMNKEVMELYKKHKVNPMSGCLPMLLQMPVFIALYQVLYQAIELKGAPFIWWINDLAAPDKLFTLSFSIPFIGDGINILPILMLGSMVWQQKLTPTPSSSPEQAKLMMLMPVIFGFIFYNLPSGLVLYWTVNNLLTIFHQLFIVKFLPHPKEAA